MIRRFTSAQFVPANAGAKAKNPVGSTLFSTPMVALLRHPGHKILRTSCHESARKRLTGAWVYLKATRDLVPGADFERDREFADSPLEGEGFEPSVPQWRTAFFQAAPEPGER